MIFIVRTDGRRPEAAGIEIKLSRATPPAIKGAAGQTDFFCLGDATLLLAAGWQVVELHDGYYEDGKGGGVAIWGQGRYWEVRSDPLTVREAVGPATEDAADRKDGEHVEVRRAIFGA